VKIGRVSADDGSPFWAIVDPDAGTARPIEEPMTAWAPKLAVGDRASVRTAAATVPMAALRLRAPVEAGSRIFAMAANYVEHLAALGATPPTDPLVFLKLDTTIIDPSSEIHYPGITSQLDFETEVVAVLARPVVPGDDPTASLLGYTIGNDVSIRDSVRVMGAPDFFTMKAHDRTSPVGPWITTLDELDGPGLPALDFTMRVNGELRQQGNTKNMLFSMSEVLEYISARNALRAGDVVFTGTTSGVGREDGRYLKPGDVLESEVPGIGVLRNTVGPR
jgi:2-keto-4-pentenoate hydratase/2-oxohepta-3-ene-1,7-dioic acid hydratase in catechol pathway